MSVHSHSIIRKCLFMIKRAPREGTITCSPKSPLATTSCDVTADELKLDLRARNPAIPENMSTDMLNKTMRVVSINIHYKIVLCCEQNQFLLQY